MTEIWFTSDHHWGDLKMLAPNNGGRRAEKFNSVEDMDEYMVEKWNSVVKPGHKVYHLGDVCTDEIKGIDAFKRIAPRLNGKKRLIFGNHDPVRELVAGGWFQKMYGVWRVFGREGFVCTHVPLAKCNFPGNEKRGRRTAVNVHGHTHERNKRLSDGRNDPAYFNVSVEQHDYAPVHFEEILWRVRELKRHA